MRTAQVLAGICATEVGPHGRYKGPGTMQCLGLAGDGDAVLQPNGRRDLRRDCGRTRDMLMPA